jgi:ABC-type branched-subunit amino acid transport system ATPase component
MITLDSLACTLGGVEIIRGASLSISRGESVGIIGPNGSGKTTLFNVMSGFAEIQRGSVVLSGRDITGADPAERAELGIGRIFQSHGVFREMTLSENIIVALEAALPFMSKLFCFGQRRRDLEQSALDFLAMVGLADKAHSKAGSLSGGQLRLLEIIRAYARGAEIFLLDEPTAGVSPKMKQEVIALIQKLHALGKTIVVIEHDMQFIEAFCSRFVVLDGGRVVLDDTPAVVRSHPLLQEIYFGVSHASR